MLRFVAAGNLPVVADRRDKIAAAHTAERRSFASAVEDIVVKKRPTCYLRCKVVQAVGADMNFLVDIPVHSRQWKSEKLPV